MSQLDPQAIGYSLRQATYDKEQREERSVAFGYEKGTPVRFAGEQMVANIGQNGQFGQIARPDNPEMRSWYERFQNGGYSVVGQPQQGGGGGAQPAQQPKDRPQQEAA